MKILRLVYTSTLKNSQGEEVAALDTHCIVLDSIKSWSLSPVWDSDEGKWQDYPKLLIITDEPAEEPPCYHPVRGEVALHVYDWLCGGCQMSNNVKEFHVGKRY